LQVERKFDFKCIITISKENVKIVELVDIDIDAKEFANKRFLKRNKIFRMLLRKLICLRLANNKRVLDVTYIINVYIKFDNYEEDV